MQIKRLLAILLSIALILSCFTFTVAAEQTESFKLSTEVTATALVSSQPYIVNQGDEITVKVNVIQNTGVSFLRIVTYFNADALSFTGCENKNLISQNETVNIGFVDNGYITYFANLSTGFSDAVGELVELKFTAKPGFCGNTGIYSELVQNREANCLRVSSDNGKTYIPFSSEDAEFSIHNITADGTVNASTCLNDGFVSYHCDSCGEDFVCDFIPAAGHKPAEAPVVENLKEATCTEDGSFDEVIYCVNCREELERNPIDIPKKGHNYEAFVTAPTCEVGGYTTYTCSYCKDTYTDNETDPIGHNYGDWTVLTPTTCVDYGRNKRVCANDPTHIITITVSPKGHTPAEAVKENEVPATCEADGHYDSVVYCTVCNEEVSRETITITAIGHDWDEGTVTVAATCTKDGVKTFTCKHNETHKRTEPIAAKGHTYANSWKYDSANHWKICTVCGGKSAAEKHNFVGGKCSSCGYIGKINFPDIEYTSWYGEAVEYAVGAGLMKGYADGKFGTSDGIQRQDFIVILARLSGANLDNYANSANFADAAKGTYYYTALAWAKAEGVSKGYDNGKFGVGDKITREQIVTFLYNYAKLKKFDITASLTETQVKSTYSDFSTVSVFAKEATLWALSKGVISGKETKTGKQIAPQANAQRCEVAKMFFNINENSIFG